VDENEVADAVEMTDSRFVSCAGERMVKTLLSRSVDPILLVESRELCRESDGGSGDGCTGDGELANVVDAGGVLEKTNPLPLPLTSEFMLTTLFRLLKLPLPEPEPELQELDAVAVFGRLCPKETPTLLLLEPLDAISRMWVLMVSSGL